MEGDSVVTLLGRLLAPANSLDQRLQKYFRRGGQFSPFIRRHAARFPFSFPLVLLLAFSQCFSHIFESYRGSFRGKAAIHSVPRWKMWKM